MNILATLEAHEGAIQTWLAQQFRLTPAPINASIDLRFSGYKIAPVDTNLFPAGFNNLALDDMPYVVQAIRSQLSARLGANKRVLLISEGHTRNPFYLNSLLQLYYCIAEAGFEVRIGYLESPAVVPPALEAVTETLTPAALTIKRRGQRLWLGDYEPDFIWLNHDLSNIDPAPLQGLAQMIEPIPQLGWGKRLKSTHFGHYEAIITELAETFAINPWQLTPLFRNCGEINFMQRTGEHCLIRHSEALFREIRAQYHEHAIDDAPFVMVKADAGTYGMGVMPIRDIDDLTNLNRKQRTKMAKTKGNQAVTQVIMQEGIHSRDRWQGQVAEPVIYFIGGEAVGGFYRAHGERDSDDNLNAPGMSFHPVSLHTSLATPDLRAYVLVATLAVLAAAREMHEWTRMAA